MSQSDQAMKDVVTYVPLWAVLMQTMAQTLQTRLVKFSQCQQTDPVFQVALRHGLVHQNGAFPFHRWDVQQNKLLETDQPAISMDRMLKYIAQLVEVVQEVEATVKFHSLKSHETTAVPWLLQISIRNDEFSTLLNTLMNNKVWNLIGVSMKPHSLHQSSQAAQLQELMCKGHAKGSRKGRKA